MSTPPRFGVREEGATYRLRPAAYAVVLDGEGRVAVVDAVQGLFLPGGGVEAGETVAECVAREVREECARELLDAVPLGEADVWFGAGAERWDSRHTFFTGRFGAETGGEPEYELQWLLPEEALERFYHESHRWAVRRALRRLGG